MGCLPPPKGAFYEFLKGSGLKDPLLAQDLMLATILDADWREMSARPVATLKANLFQSVLKVILNSAKLEEVLSVESHKARRERDLAYAGKGACKIRDAKIKSLEEGLRIKEREKAEVTVALEKQKEKRRLLKAALKEKKQRVVDAIVEVVNANARAEAAVKRAEDAVARAGQVEADMRACIEATSKACEDRVRAAEEGTRGAEEKARDIEERVRSIEKKLRGAEEEARLAMPNFKSSKTYEDELLMAGSYSYGLGCHDMFNKIQLHFPKIDFAGLKPCYEEAIGIIGEDEDISDSSSSESGGHAAESGAIEGILEEDSTKGAPAGGGPAEEAAAEVDPLEGVSSEEIPAWTP